MLSQCTPYGDAASIDATASYDCSGDGADTSRAVVTGYAESGKYAQSVQSSDYIVISCQ